MNKLFRGLVLPTVCFVLLGASVVSADAANIPVFNTGVAAGGTKLTAGADPHWTVVSGPGISTPFSAVVLANQHPLGQYFSTPDSAWIWSNATGASVVGGPYTFELQFDLTNFDPTTAVLSGFWGADNTGSIRMNGANPTGTGTFALFNSVVVNFNLLHSFSITGGFVAGINKLDITVVDTANPGGLNVNGLNLSATPLTFVPEPDALALAGLGLVAMVAVRGSRRRLSAEA